MPDVQTQLRRYLEETPEVTVEEVTAPSIAPTTVRPKRVDGWRGPLVAVGTAVAVLVAVGVAVLALRGNGASITDTGTPATTIPATPVITVAPADVFDMRTDSFCEWFTAQDMNEIVAVAQQRADTNYVLEEFAADGCDEFWRAPNWGGSRGPAAGDEPLSLAVLVTPEELAPDGLKADPYAFSGHRLLDSAVSYQHRTYQFAWREGWDGFLKVEGHGYLYFGFGVDHHDGVNTLTPQYEEFGLAVANEMLRRMNWIGSE